MKCFHFYVSKCIKGIFLADFRIIIVMAEAQIDVKFIPTKRGGNNLEHGGYIYRSNRVKGSRTYWKCTVSGCPATLNTHNDIPVGFGRHRHNHQSDHAAVVAKQIMHCITNRCKDEICPIPSIFAEEITNLRDNDWDEESKTVIEHLPTFYSAKSPLYRSR